PGPLRVHAKAYLGRAGPGIGNGGKVNDRIDSLEGLGQSCEIGDINVLVADSGSLGRFHVDDGDRIVLLQALHDETSEAPTAAGYDDLLASHSPISSGSSVGVFLLRKVDP